MTLSKGDIAICQEHARAIITTVLEEHIESCPIGRSLTKFMFLSIGIAVGSGLVSASTVIAMLKLVMN